MYFHFPISNFFRHDFYVLFFSRDFPDGIALKIMSKQLLAREKKIAAAKRERNILDRMNHPGITSLLFTFQDSHSLYLGLSPMPGGELYDQIRLKGAMAEDEVRMYAADIIDILGYLRHERVIFRDLKVNRKENPSFFPFALRLHIS